MVVLLVFMMMAGGAGFWYHRTHPLTSGQLLGRARSLANGGVTGLSPKVLGDRTVREVIRGAVQMPNGTRHVRNQVHVYLSDSLWAYLGQELLGELGQQVREAIDAEIARRQWTATGATGVRFHTRSSLSGDEVSIELAGGTHTVILGDSGDTDGVGATAPLSASIDMNGRTYPLPRGRDALLGRAPGAVVPLPATGKETSRHQAAVSFVDGVYSLRDLSTNGTWVDGVQVEPGASVELTDGARIGFPDGTEAVFHLGTALDGVR